MQTHPETTDPPAVAYTASPLQEKLARNVVSTLIMTMVQRFPKKVRKSIEQYDVQLIIGWIYRKVLKEVNLEPLATLDMVTYNKFIKTVIEDLLQQYHCQEKLLEALISDEPSFDDVVSNFLIKNLQTFNLASEKSNFKKFFTALGRALLKPASPPLGIQTVS